MRRVILESPYAGDVEANVAYARACLRDCLERGEAPIASHLLYTQPGVLVDGDPFERKWGIDAGLVWSDQAQAAVFYVDRGWSAGMRIAKMHHLERGVTVEERMLPGYGTCRHCGLGAGVIAARSISSPIYETEWIDGTHRACNAPACAEKELTF
jgi:hypothetical protein